MEILASEERSGENSPWIRVPPGCTGGSLLPDAEAAEDAVEDVVGDDGADDFAQFVDGLPEVEGHELVATAFEQGLGRGLEGLARRGRGSRGNGRRSPWGVAVGRPRLQRGGDGGAKLVEARAGLGAGRQGIGGEVRGGEVALGPDAEVSGSGLDRTSRGRCRTTRRRAGGRRGPPARRGGPAPGPRSGRCRARPRRCRSARRSGPRSRRGPTGSRGSSPPGARPGPGAGR